MPGEDRRKRATIHDVARQAGVSAATVSKVLRGATSVKAENSAKIHAAVRELSYRMDPLAAGLRHELRRIIGAVVPDLESPFFGALVTGIERAAEEAGYSVIIASSRECEEREADLVARMNDWRVAGSVLVPIRSERGMGAEKLHQLGMEAVLVDRVSADERFDTVSADNFGASARVADFLMDQGARHVLLHGATRTSKAIRTRVAGFTKQARTRNPGVRIDTLLSDDDLETHREAVRAYFDAHPGSNGPDAIFSLSQHSTLLVLSELRRRGLRVPEQIALVGFDDADWMQTTWPSITAVAQPVVEMAERAVAMLLARVDGRRDGSPVQNLELCTLLSGNRPDRRKRSRTRPDTADKSGRKHQPRRKPCPD